MISLYLILGIGVDAIFVLANTYALSHLETPHGGAQEVEMRPTGSEGESEAVSLRARQAVLSAESVPHHRQGEVSLNVGGEKLAAPVDTTAVVSMTHSSSITADERDNRPLVLNTQSTSTDDHAHDTRVLARTLRQAGGITLLSTTTTAVAFGASVASPIRIIRQFALFQTLTVLSAFMLVELLFVPLLVVWRRRLFSTHQNLKWSLVPRAPRALITIVSWPARAILAPSTTAFWERFGPLVHRCRFGCMLAWAVVICVQGMACTRLQPIRAAPTLFGADHNNARMLHMRQFAFVEPAVSLSEAMAWASRIGEVPDLGSTAMDWLKTPDGRTCAAVCNLVFLRDGTCDDQCDVAACKHDGGDCTESVPRTTSPPPPVPPSPSLVQERLELPPASLLPPTPPMSAPLPPLIPGHRLRSPPSPPLSPAQPLALAPLANQTLPMMNTSGIEPPPHVPSPPKAQVCLPLSETISTQCASTGICREPGYCQCFEGYAGERCEESLGAHGLPIRLLPAYKAATVHLVFGLHPKPARALDGTPRDISLHWSSGSLLDPVAQRIISELCAYLAIAPPHRVRKGSLRCPIRDLQLEREALGQSWPAPSDEALNALSGMARSEPRLLELMGTVGDGASRQMAWLAISLQTNVLAAGSAEELRESADWFEALMDRVNADDDAAGRLHGWQTSDGWVWMEAVEQAGVCALHACIGLHCC